MADSAGPTAVPAAEPVAPSENDAFDTFIVFTVQNCEDSFFRPHHNVMNTFRKLEDAIQYVNDRAAYQDRRPSPSYQYYVQGRNFDTLDGNSFITAHTRKLYERMWPPLEEQMFRSWREDL